MKNIHSKRSIKLSNNLLFDVDKNNKITDLRINNISIPFSSLQFKNHLIKKIDEKQIIIEDLENHPMNLGKRWKILKEIPEYKLSYHQKRFIITLKEKGSTHIHIIPKFMKNGECAAEIIHNKKHYQN